MRIGRVPAFVAGWVGLLGCTGEGGVDADTLAFDNEGTDLEATTIAGALGELADRVEALEAEQNGAAAEIAEATTAAADAADAADAAATLAESADARLDALEIDADDLDARLIDAEDAIVDLGDEVATLGAALPPEVVDAEGRVLGVLVRFCTQMQPTSCYVVANPQGYVFLVRTTGLGQPVSIIYFTGNDCTGSAYSIREDGIYGKILHYETHSGQWYRPVDANGQPGASVDAGSFRHYAGGCQVDYPTSGVAIPLEPVSATEVGIPETITAPVRLRGGGGDVD